MNGAPQNFTEYQEVVMSCIYRKNIVQLLTPNIVSYFCIRLPQLQVKSSLTVSTRETNRKKNKQAHLSATEVEKDKFCPQLCLCMVMALLGL